MTAGQPPPETPVRIALLVEDNPGDALLIQELLEKAGSPAVRVMHVMRLGEALTTMKAEHVDVILLDLRLPDANGIETVQQVRAASQEVPIVVLTGLDDEDLALACIQEGAQDYICKSELRPTTLRRAIGYAISRLRETQVRELRAMLEEYTSLTSAGAGTSITAALAGTGAVSERYPNIFLQLVREYIGLLAMYCEPTGSMSDKPREFMEHIVTNIGNAGGGPRDLLDVHVRALDELVKGRGMEQSRAVALEGRLLALEMMGLLVDFYRVGNRRRFTTKETT